MNIGLLVFLIPASILIVPGAGEVSISVLAVLGIAKTVKDRSNPLTHPGNRVLTVICWTFFLISLLSVLASDPSFVGILFVTTPDIFKRVIHGTKAGAIFAGIIAVIQFVFLDLDRANGAGAVNAIVFGDIAGLLGVISMVNFYEETKKEKAVSGLSFCLALLATLLSGSRGAWIAVIILSIVLFIIWWSVGFLSRSRLATGLLAAGIVVAGAISTPAFQYGYNRTLEQLNNFEDFPRTVRTVMWKAGWKAFLNAPVLGHGHHRTNASALPYIESTRYREPISRFSHLHNEYVNTLVGKGLLGLGSLLLLLFGPVLVLRKHLKSGSEYTYAAIGILVCAGYAVFGLTNLAFGHGIMNTFYVFMLSICLNQATLFRANKTASGDINEQIADPHESINS